MNNGDWLKDIIKETRQLLEQHAQGPRRTILLSPEVAAMLENLVPAADAPACLAEEPVADAGATDAVSAEESAADSAETVDKATDEAAHAEGLRAALAALAKEVALCFKCGLAECRTQTVFGDGSSDAELVFVGEAPGAEEDRQGKPFVGRAGQLLTDIIEKGMHLRRRDVYICNVLKCRPPENRNPSPEEVYYCEPYLVRQLEIIQPKVICALGKYAAQTLLKSTAPVNRLRGQWWKYHGIPLRVTYHPAYLLRNPADKKNCWLDIQEVMKVLRGEVTP